MTGEGRGLEVAAETLRAWPKVWILFQFPREAPEQYILVYILKRALFLYYWEKAQKQENQGGSSHGIYYFKILIINA